MDGASIQSPLCALADGQPQLPAANCRYYPDIVFANNTIFISARQADGPAIYRRTSLGTVENHLIELLPRKDRLHLLGVSELVELELGEVLCEPGHAIRHVYFPTEASISLIAQIEGSPGVEVGMVGREGMLGAQMALGVATAPVHAVVQSPGAARRIGANDFRGELAHSPALLKGMHQYLYVRMAQMATSAACLRFHLIGPRLARWLLMSQDRAYSDSFRVTHEFLAAMLGVRREGITAAASALQRSGLIEYRRGNLKVIDRLGLEAAACGCYAVERQAYAALLC
jgi:CRP-like cAMP-binding protein